MGSSIFFPKNTPPQMYGISSEETNNLLTVNVLKTQMKDKEVNVKQNSLIVSHQHTFVDMHSPLGAKHPNVSHQYLSKKAGSSLVQFPTTKIRSLVAISSSPKMP